MSHPGTAAITLDTTGGGHCDITPSILSLQWKIKQVAIKGIGNGSVQCVLNGLPCTSVCTAAFPMCASGDPTIDVGPHETFSVVVTNGTPNDHIVVSYFYDEEPAN